MSEIANPFLAATKSKLRFVASNGHLSSEDLWDLSLKDLDRMGGSIIDQLGGGRGSLLTNPDRQASKAEADNRLRLEVIKEVIRVKEEENAAKLNATKTKAQLAFLTGLREKKKMEQLEGLSVDEIEAQIAALEGNTVEAEVAAGV